MERKSVKSLLFNRISKKSRIFSTSESLRVELLEPRTLLSTLIDIDPSNNLRRATTIDLDGSGTTKIESDISNSRDKDAYVFTANSTGLMTVKMEAVAGDGNWLDPIIIIYDARRHKITANDDANPASLDAAAEFYVEAGQSYYVLADGLKSSWGDYVLTLVSPDENSPAYEAVDYPDTIATAMDITAIITTDGLTCISGGISDARDADFFAFTAGTGGDYTISLQAADSLLDTYLYVYNENGKLIDHNDDIAWPETDSELVIAATAGETLYIRADAWRGSTGVYDLSITLTTADIDNSGDVDDTDDTDGTGDTSGDTSGDAGQGVDPVEGYLVSVSAYDYAGTINDLAGPLFDSQITAQVFTDVYGFSQSNIHIISGGEDTLTYEAIAAEFQWLASVVDSNDVVVFHYSGHGLSGASVSRNDNEGLYIPDGSVIYQADLTNWLNQISATAVKLVLLDSCYSGGLTALASDVSNTCVIASSRYDQTSWDEVEQFTPANSPFNGGGVFASWFGYGLTTRLADTNGNGNISIREIFNYVDSNINRITGRGRYNQDPVISSSLNLDYEILLG